jgi:hypothetical protein
MAIQVTLIITTKLLAILVWTVVASLGLGPSMMAWLMHSAVSGRAKEVITTENDRLRNLGLPELQPHANV